MNKKLTLLLDEKIIARAKDYADKNHVSLSGMVEKYFAYLTQGAVSLEEDVELPEDIEEIIGIVNVPEALDVKADYRSSRSGRGAHD